MSEVVVPYTPVYGTYTLSSLCPRISWHFKQPGGWFTNILQALHNKLAMI